MKQIVMLTQVGLMAVGLQTDESRWLVHGNARRRR